MSATRGGGSAIFDEPTRLRVSRLISTRQRIHAGRVLSDFPTGGVVDLKPEESREAKAIAEEVVRRSQLAGKVSATQPHRPLRRRDRGYASSGALGMAKILVVDDEFGIDEGQRIHGNSVLLKDTGDHALPASKLIRPLSSDTINP